MPLFGLGSKKRQPQEASVSMPAQNARADRVGTSLNGKQLTVKHMTPEEWARVEATVVSSLENMRIADEAIAEADREIAEARLGQAAARAQIEAARTRAAAAQAKADAAQARADETMTTIVANNRKLEQQFDGMSAIVIKMQGQQTDAVAIQKLDVLRQKIIALKTRVSENPTEALPLGEMDAIKSEAQVLFQSLSAQQQR